MSEEKVQLVFLSPDGVSHIKPTVQFAKSLINYNNRFNVTILIIPALYTGSNPQNYIDSVTNSDPRLRFISFPSPDVTPPSAKLYQQNVKEAITKLTSHPNSNSVRLFIDMFNICMVDVAKELSIPCYFFYTSGAANVGFLLLLAAIDSKITTTGYIEYATELEIPSYVNPLPTSSLPPFYSNRNSVGFKGFVAATRLYHETDGIIVNSFDELELQAVRAFDDGLIGNIPPVYLVGPFLDPEGHSSFQEREEDKIIMKWLDDQPESSVLFISFGTVVSVGAEQVKEIANGLERSGERFLWLLRGTKYTNLEEEVVLLPDGFLERVGGRGLVCEWVPQVEVLSHKSTRGFITHCGWNSVLESVWFGVPMLTWPLEADQLLNAFQLVKDLGLAVEIREGHHRKEGNNLVVADEVEKGVKDFVESASDLRKKMMAMSVKCRKALMEGGSSSSTLKCLVQDLILTNQL